jgi:hypothetical protein
MIHLFLNVIINIFFIPGIIHAGFANVREIIEIKPKKDYYFSFR